VTLEEIVAVCERRGLRVERHGQRYRVQCPAHAAQDQKDCNLALDRGSDGRVLVKCQSHQCTVFEVAPALGLAVSDFMPAQVPLNGGGLGEPLVRYPYRDESGRNLFWVGRFAGKEFRQWREGPHGEQLWGLGQARRVLFGLPELLATKPGETVVIVEGEKDAIAVASLGIAATTNPMGAGKWRQEYTDWLKQHLPDRKFVILPDNDQPGIEHADAVCESLKRAGLDCRIVGVPHAGPKGDVSDWVAAGGTAEQLQEILRPPRHPLFEGIVNGPQLQALKIKVPHPLVPNLVWPGASTLLAGDSKLGKSSLLLRMMLAMACGGWWLDRDRRPENRLTQSRVLFLNFEDPLFVTQDRAVRMMAPDGLPENFLTRPVPYGFSFAEILEFLPEAKRELELDCVVLDPIAILAEWEDENDNAEVARSFKALQQVATETGLAILSIHHVTKKPGQRGLNIRGGSAIKANVLGYLVLEEDKNGIRLAGINKITGEWDVYLGRREHDYSWWIESEREGSTRTPQQAAKDEAKGDLYSLVRGAPGLTTTDLANTLELPERTCRRYLGEMEESGLIFSHELPREPGRRGEPETGWFATPETGD
jgi:putative DNA primase/helicase